MKKEELVVLVVVGVFLISILLLFGNSITGHAVDDRVSDFKFLKFLGFKKVCDENGCHLEFVGGERNCKNLIDDDKDGLVDCQDEDCYRRLNDEGFACCNDDGDSFGGHCPRNTNCDDGSYYETFQCLECLEGEWECPDKYYCEAGSCVFNPLDLERSCKNLVDDDGDGLIDCLDEDCLGRENANGLICCYDGDSVGGSCLGNTLCDDGSYYETFQCLECLEGELDCGEGECVDGYCDVVEEDFVFTWWGYENRLGYPDGHPWRIDFDVVDDLMDIGFTHVSVRMDETLDYTEDLNRLKDEGYDIALEIAGVGTVPLMSQETDEDKYLDAACLNKDLCEQWNFYRSVDPSYRGEVWDDTLGHWEEIIGLAEPDLVYTDLEMWFNPENYEGYYLDSDPNEDCNCPVIEEGIGYDQYIESWEENYFIFHDTIRNEDADADIYFFNNLQEDNCIWRQDHLGNYISLSSEDMSVREGNPGLLTVSLYILPNLQLIEKNIQECNYPEGFMPYLSFNHVSYFASADEYEETSIYFDSSVSREAGRMLSEAGAKGAIIYPSITQIDEFWEGEGYGYWLDHAEQLVLGFKEADGYVERNKIKNYDFEAFKPISSEIRSLEGRYFIPLYWQWEDSNTKYSGDDADLSRDFHSGTYSWNHLRRGDVGVRTITSDEFEIEEGDYEFSIWTKTSVGNSGSKINFYLGDERLGQVDFEDGWNEFETVVELEKDDYVLKIVIEDNLGESVEVYLDDVSLILV